MAGVPENPLGSAGRETQCPLCRTPIVQTIFRTVACRYCPSCQEPLDTWTLGMPAFARGDEVAVAARSGAGAFELRRLTVKAVVARALNHAPLYLVALRGDERPWRFESELLRFRGEGSAAQGWTWSAARDDAPWDGWGIAVEGRVVGLSVQWADRLDPTGEDEALCWERAAEASGQSILELRERGARFLRLRIAPAPGAGSRAWRPALTPALARARRTLADELARAERAPQTLSSQNRGTA